MAKKDLQSSGATPKEMASTFSQFINEASTPKGIKVQAFFNHLDDSDKRVIYNNVSKAYETHQANIKAQSERLKEKKKEVSDLKKRAKELGFKLV